MKKKILIIFGSLLLVAIGIFVYFEFFREKKNADVLPETKTENTANSNIKSIGPPIAEKWQHDKDQDTILDEKEKELGTSDLEVDTDGDGLLDADEINKWKTNPTKFDTDGDGFADFLEIINGYNPNGPGKLLESDSKK